MFLEYNINLPYAKFNSLYNKHMLKNNIFRKSKIVLFLLIEKHTINYKNVYWLFVIQWNATDKINSNFFYSFFRLVNIYSSIINVFLGLVIKILIQQNS